eukprot:Lankesteria_metandrocarpae@DN5302_c1_g1_i1.p1
MVFGLKAVDHVMLFASNKAGKVKGEWNGKPDSTQAQTEIGRPFTPCSPVDAKGYVDFVIKAYPPNTDFVDGGKFSNYVRSVKTGDTLRMKGPMGKIRYEEAGKIKYAGKYLPGDAKTEINMISGGSGITPMLQTLYQLLNSESEDDQRISFRLVFSNKTQADIICRAELDELAAKHPKRFKVWYTIQNGVEPGWQYSTGKVDRAMLESHLFAPSGHTACQVCGPPGLVDVSKAALVDIGHAENVLF